MVVIVVGGTPLPISNREVKPTYADGTTKMWKSRKPPTKTTYKLILNFKFMKQLV